MKHLSKIALVCTSLLLVSTSSLYAGNRPGALTFKLGGGYIYLNDSRDLKNHGLVMGAVSYNLTEHWGLQGMVAGFRTHFDKSVDDKRRVDVALFNFDGLYHILPGNTIDPYVAAGVGITGFNPTKSSDAHNQSNINAALGAQVFATPSIALDLEARDIYTWVGGKNDVMLSAGLSWLVDMC